MNGLAMLNEWRDARLTDVVADRNGGVPDGSSSLVDPLFHTLREGGPIYTRDSFETYQERLRATGREHHAESVEVTRGVVHDSALSWLELGTDN
jgi:hypothetical protein